MAGVAPLEPGAVLGNFRRRNAAWYAAYIARDQIGAVYTIADTTRETVAMIPLPACAIGRTG